MSGRRAGVAAGCALVALVGMASAEPLPARPGETRTAGAEDPAGAQDALARVLAAELERSMRGLALPGLPRPYYLGYWVVDTEQLDVTASFGASLGVEHERQRGLAVQLRVGSPRFDNTGFVPGGDGYGAMLDAARGGRVVPLPIDDQAPALRRVLWLATDRAFKGAAQTFAAKQAARRGEAAGQDEPASFSAERAVQLTLRSAQPALEVAKLEAQAAEISEVFREYPAVQHSRVRIMSSRETRRFASSEGSRVSFGTPMHAWSIEAATQADDGMRLSHWYSFVTPEDEGPRTDALREEARRLARELTSLRRAPVLEDYSGPVLFEGLAAAQIVQDLLSDSLSGTPPPKGMQFEAGSLARKVGKRILPSGFEVFDDPTVASHAGVTLAGHYVIDDEGVLAQRVQLIEAGRLRRFLMSRTPRRGFERSNGHGRSGLGGWARGHVGNLFVRSSRGLSEARLRARLLAAVRAEGGTHGFIIRLLAPRARGSNGVSPPAPVLVYRVSLDGREQLVRGATLSPISVRELKDVLAAGKSVSVYNYLMPTGAFDIPASVIAPSLLFEDLELRRPEGPHPKPPALPHPHFPRTETARASEPVRR